MAEKKNKKSLEEKIKDLKIPISTSFLSYLKIQHPRELEIFVDLLSQCTARNIDLSKIDTPEEWLEKFSNNRNLQTEFLKKKKYLPAKTYERLDRLSEAIKKKYPHVPNIFKEGEVIKKKEVEKKEGKKEIKTEKKEDITEIENIIKKNLEKYSKTRDPKILKELQKFQKDIKEIAPKLKNKEDKKRLEFLSQEIKNVIKITEIENIIKKNLEKYSETKDPEILKELQKFQEDIKEIAPKLKNKEDIQRLQSLSQKIESVIEIKVGITPTVSTEVSTEKPKGKKEILNLTQVSKIPGIIVEQNKDGSLNNISFNIEEINKLSPEDKEKTLKLSLKDISNTTNKEINIDTPIFIKTDDGAIKLNPDFQNEMVKLHDYEVVTHDNKISLVPYKPTKIEVGKPKETPIIPISKEGKGKKTTTAKLKVEKEIKIPPTPIAETKPVEKIGKPEETVPTVPVTKPTVPEIPEIKEPEIPVQLPITKPEVPIIKAAVSITPEIKIPEKAPTPTVEAGPVEEIKAPQKGIKLAPYIYTAPTKKYISPEAGGPEEIPPPPPVETETSEQYIEEQVKKAPPLSPTKETPTTPEEGGEGEITPKQREEKKKEGEEGKKKEEKEKAKEKETPEEQAKKEVKKEAKKQIKKELIAFLLENPYVLVIILAIFIILFIIIIAFASTTVEEQLRESREICQNEPDKTSPEKCAEIETEFKQFELGKEGSECTLNAHCDTGLTCVDGACKSGEEETTP